MSQTRKVEISYRDCRVDYEVDKMSVAALAAKYDIDWADMKSALRQYGIVIRKGEIKPTTPPKAYTVVLTDTDKIVNEPETVSVTTAQ